MDFAMSKHQDFESNGRLVFARIDAPPRETVGEL
jgi:hypothetical protein